MKLFKSRDPNTIHYVTSVTFRRVPIFRSDTACSLFINTLDETRSKYPFKLVGYVVMPDHVHLLMNPQSCNISDLMRRLKGISARRILDWLREENRVASLAKLRLDNPQRRAHTHAVWLKDFSAVGLWSPKFIRQKLHYIHCNPVRAGLCEHPANWRWSSYHAYLPHKQGDVPIEMDWRAFWELEAGGHSPPLNGK
jgi:putative transposase